MLHGGKTIIKESGSPFILALILRILINQHKHGIYILEDLLHLPPCFLELTTTSFENYGNPQTTPTLAVAYTS